MSRAEHSSLSLSRLARAAFFRAVNLFAIFSATLAAGFLLFANYVSVMPMGSSQAADGIVALTGDDHRIAEAVRLLAEGKAARLLISGVNKSTRRPQIINRTVPAPDTAVLFRCCVDLDKRALNTEDNAVETTAWARSRGYRSLILVTSAYHMPRALIELRQSMPDVEIVAYPVKSPRLENQWWTDPRTSWVLGKEYMKFITAGVRYAAFSLKGWFDGFQPPKRTINANLD